ncbi:hypothetical protein [Scytonema millei]|uniref:Uncharacterized protein n=1 Tax=Scytonema millei VB511283 TaxID=1245923 RepID=A0A9X5E1V4_9CYAN|nr:hypothetical protein [Scytonema millei]NHC33654.1 hypothetical protein [Scytonema millei VB511283]
MIGELSTTVPDYIEILSKVASDRRPAAKVVVSALLQAERAAKQQRLVYPLESLLGDWRLYFTAPRNAKLKNGIAQGNGFYIPQIAPAQISFHAREYLEISNQIQFGSLLFKLTGPARYLGKKNLLAFDFTQMQLCLFNRTVYQGKFNSGKKLGSFEEQPISKLPFFAFFLVTEDYIAARGRGGGLAIWVKQD